MKFLRFLATLFVQALLHVQVVIDRMMCIPLPLGMGADLAVTAAGVLGSATATREYRFNFGATVTAGQHIYLDRLTNTWKLVDANAGTTGNEIDTITGIAENGGASGQPAVVVTKDPDFTPGATMTNGLVLYSSNTPGGITQADIPTTGAYPRCLGVAKSTTKMNLNPTASGVIM